MAKPQDDYAKNQRRIRSAQPKVSSDEAHARARHALAVNSRLEAEGQTEADASKEPAATRKAPTSKPPKNLPARPGKSSPGPGARDA